MTRQGVIIIFFLTGTVVMMFLVGKQGHPLSKASSTPCGIINLELAYNNQLSSAIIKDWMPHDPDFRDHISIAKTNTYLDFAFIFFYALFLYNASRSIYQRFGGKFGKTGKWMMKVALLAGCLDVVENGGMLLTLNGKGSDVISGATALCSAIKWMSVIIVVLYVLLGGVASLRARFSR